VEPDARAITEAPPPASAGAAVDLAIEGLLALGELGEDVDEEWQYVQDLVAAWRTRLEAVAAERGVEALPPATAEAVARVVAEARLVSDPHRAIDWLSTLPQVVLIAIGERP
jgi:hypothetical protein